jgi:outer membrane immunogenic protein
MPSAANWADFSGSNVSFLFAPDFNRTRVDAFGLITGQIGYAWNNVLFYAKGGAAVTGDKYDAFSGRTGLLLASANETRWGGTLGAGLEFGFARNWSLGVEYDHLFMGSRDITLTAPLFLSKGAHQSGRRYGSGSPELSLRRLRRLHGPVRGPLLIL